MQSLKSLEAKLKAARKDQAYHEAQAKVCAQDIRKLEAEIKAFRVKLPISLEIRTMSAEDRLELAKKILRSQGIGWFCDHRRKTQRWSLKPSNRLLTPKIIAALNKLSDGSLLRGPKGRGPQHRFYSSVWTEGKPYRWYFQK